MTSLVLYMVFAPILGLLAGLFAAVGNLRAAFALILVVCIGLLAAAPLQQSVDCTAHAARAFALAGDFQ